MGGGGGSGGGVGGASVRVAPSFVTVGGRQRFEVELRPGETTIVSWKKLVKDVTKANGGPPAAAPPPPTNAHPALESRIAPGLVVENEAKDAPPTSRFSAVIEKIERLYMGKHSSDEEDLNDVPDDDEYDTEDSFIDDAELDEYFQVDNSAMKHDGFFVNRGKLERIEPTLAPNQQPRKRRRKDLGKGRSGSDDGHGPTQHAIVGKKAAAKLLPSDGKSSPGPSHNVAIQNVQYMDVKIQNQGNSSEVHSRKKSAEAKLDPSPSRVPNADAPVEQKDIDKQKTGIVPLKNNNKFKEGGEILDATDQRMHDRGALVKHQAGKLASNVDEFGNPFERREKNGTRERSDINIVEGKNTMQSTKVSVGQRKEGSGVRPKSSMLEKAIRELENTVAESRPPLGEVPDADTSAQAVKRRLPSEIKQRLAKVARLAQASHGKISKELISRLMNIVGHLIQLRTLKRNLKIMVNMGLSAKQEKDDRFQQIKREVVEMIKLRVPLMKSKTLEQQAGGSDDFQETSSENRDALKRRSSMDDALEDKICDLYDLYVDGLDEDAGPQVRKLYVELADLWPSGFMDNHGVKRAICRAKDRRRTLYSRQKDQEKIKRKKMLTPKTETVRLEASSIAQAQYVPDKLVSDLSPYGLTSSNRPSSNVPAANSAIRMPSATLNGPNADRPKQEKVKGSSGSQNDLRLADTFVKKKLKRKPESELGETHFRPDKLSSLQGEERRVLSHKQVVVALQKPNIQSAGLPPSFEQPS